MDWVQFATGVLYACLIALFITHIINGIKIKTYIPLNPLQTIVRITTGIWVCLFMLHKIIGKNKDYETYGASWNSTIVTIFPINILSHEHFYGWWDELIAWILLVVLVVLTDRSIYNALVNKQNWLLIFSWLVLTTHGIYELHHQKTYHDMNKRISSKIALVLSIFSAFFFISSFIYLLVGTR
jgi:hypothetical protein